MVPNKAAEVRVRAVVIDPSRRNMFLAQANNRAAPGSIVLMLPGGQSNDGEGELTALARYLAEDVGISVELCPENTRFIMSRTYQSPDDGVPTRVNFYCIEVANAVPRNMRADTVLSVSWLSLDDVHRYLELDGAGWKIQLGALDAVETILDPERSKTLKDGSRELARQDGGTQEDGEKLSRPTRLPYSA